MTVCVWRAITHTVTLKKCLRDCSQSSAASFFFFFPDYFSMFVYWVKHPLSCLIYYIQYMPRLQVMAHWRVLLWVQATSSLSNSSAARIKLRISRVPLLNLFNRLLSASLFLLGLPPSFLASRGFVARRWRLLALPRACTPLSKYEEKERLLAV